MNPNAFKLSIEQQFELQRIVNASIHVTPDEAANLLVQQTRLLMVKDNVSNPVLKNGA